jgi:8-oxo-dGTP diphosphatase
MQKGFDFTGVSIVFFCHDGEGNFLLSKRSTNCRDEHGTWDPGGGGLEVHDTVEDTIRKEIKEEYCADVLAQEFLGFRDVHREHEGKKTHWIALDFKVLIDKTQVKNGEPHKLEEIGWFRLETLPSPLHSQFPYFLEKYREKLARKNPD